MKPICITSGPPTRKRERNRFWQGNTKVITILSLKLMQHIQVPIRSNTLRKRCPNSKLFWSTLLRISPYSVRMWENTDQNNSEYGHFLRSDSQYMTLLFHVAPDGRIIEIKHNLEKIEIHRAYQCYNILRGSFSNRNNLRALIQSTRRQSQHLIRWFLIKENPIHFHIKSNGVIPKIK